MNQSKPFSATTLAERWEVSRQHIHNLIKKGDIQNTFEIGNLVRIPAWEVERIESCGNLNSTEESGAPLPSQADKQLGDLYVPPMQH